MRRALHTLRILTVVAIGFPAACNIFIDVDYCSEDDPCPAGFACDFEGRFCFDQRDAALPDGGTDAEAAPPLSDAADVELDAPPPCDSVAEFGTPVLVPGLEKIGITSARLSPDETQVYFSALNGCSIETCYDLLIADRPTRGSAFGGAVPLVVVNAAKTAEYWPTLTEDGTFLFFESGRSLKPIDGAYANDRARIWSASRSGAFGDFGEPTIQSLFQVDGGLEGSPYLHPAKIALYFISAARSGKGSFDIFVARLTPAGGAYEVKNVTGVNTAYAEYAPVVTRDNLTLYFAREVAPKFERKIFVSTRPNETDAGFEDPKEVKELNLPPPHEQWPSWISQDQCRLYFVSDRVRPDGGVAEAGTGVAAFRLWVAERPKTK